MKGYKPYPAYKDSGVEWIGRVPEHWVVGRLQYFSRGISTGPFGTALGTDDYITGGIPVINPSHITADGCTPQANVTVTAVTAGHLSFWALRPGDIVAARRGELGRAAVVRSDQDGWICGTGSIRITPHPDKITSCYIHTALQTHYARAWLKLSSVGSTMPNLNEELIGNLPLAVPPMLAEQAAIAASLARETARIDALGAKKTRFIALLKEKRRALITHAVTKGLDPTVKRKDSGVEWIGEVPAHWDVCKLNFRYSVDLGKMLDQKRINGAHPVQYLRNQDVQWGAISATNLPVMDIRPEEFDRYTAMEGDLLVCEGGDVGRAAIWHGQPTGYQKALHRLRPRASDCPIFMFNVLTAAKACGAFAASDSKSTISHLTAEAFREYRFPFPPHGEQRRIMATIHRETGRINKLLSKVERSVALLKERRAALITAAVTGQIDLRATGEAA